jgi:hypothetical protein
MAETPVRFIVAEGQWINIDCVGLIHFSSGEGDKTHIILRENIVGMNRMVYLSTEEEKRIASYLQTGGN